MHCRCSSTSTRQTQKYEGRLELQQTMPLRRVIQYHVYRDLERGWRVTAPNLEDLRFTVL